MRGLWGDVRTYGRMDRCLEIHPCVLQDIGPLKPLPKKEKIAVEEEEIVAKAVEGQRYPMPLG